MHFNKHSLILHQIQEYVDIIRSVDLKLATGSDFSFFTSIPKLQTARHNINPAFDPINAELNERNAFWMIVVNDANEIVGTQAMQILPMQGASLGDYLEKNIWNFRTYGYDLDQKKTQWYLTSEASKMTGVVAYHGELWLDGSQSGLRGGSMAVMLTRLMILVGMLKWAPDYFIGLQSPLTSCRGLAVREGYMHTEQRSILWYQKKSDTPMEDWLVWMSKEEAEFNLRLPPSFFQALLENPATDQKKSQLGRIA